MKDLTLTQTQTLKLIQTCLDLGHVKSLDIDSAIRTFITIKKTEGVRPDTIKYYEVKLSTAKIFLDYKNIDSTDKITNELIFEYVEYLFSKERKKSYINKVVNALIYMHNKLSDMNYIDKYNFNFKKMKETVKEIKILEPIQLEKLMNYIETKKTNHQIAFRLFLETGIRRSELINIKICNIDFKEKKIYLEHTKNHDPRYIFVSDTTIQLIQCLIQTYSQSVENLFYNKVNKKNLTTSYIDSLFAKTKKDLDFDNLGPHLLRHTYCTYMARSTNIDIKCLQTLMGHKTLQMTLRYIELVKHEDLANASVNNNPISLY